MKQPAEPDHAGDAARFEQLALAWDEARSDAKRANPFSDQMWALANSMRETEEGRRGIESLLSHPNRGVRIWAGGQCLAWAPEKAIPVLEALRDSEDFYSLDAKYTLIEYRSGKLFQGWAPS